MSDPKAEFFIDEVACNRILMKRPTRDALQHVGKAMVLSLRMDTRMYERTGDRSPRRSHAGSKNRGLGYTHNSEGYKAIRGFQDDGLPVTWVVSTQHFTMLEFGSHDGKTPARHWLSSTLIMFRV